MKILDAAHYEANLVIQALDSRVNGKGLHPLID